MTITRRDIVLGTVAAAAAPRGAMAQPAARVQRVSIYSARAVRNALVAALRERGWAEGGNMTIDWQGAEGSEARIGEHRLPSITRSRRTRRPAGSWRMARTR